MDGLAWMEDEKVGCLRLRVNLLDVHGVDLNLQVELTGAASGASVRAGSDAADGADGADTAVTE